MKFPLPIIACASLAFIQSGLAQSSNFTNFIRQVQLPTEVKMDVSVDSAGEALSALAIDPGGARFELWTVQSDPLKSYLLRSRYVGAYVPIADLTISSEDMSSTILRTRADRPFYVNVTLNGLLNGETDPPASKSVKFLRHVQSYGVNGTGIDIDRNQAILLTQVALAENGAQTLTYAINEVPGADRAKVRGEERFSIYSLEDYQAPESLLASQFIQIWPVADGAISGIANNQLIRFTVPTVTLTLNDLYPNSQTYAQVYEGDPRLGVSGTVVPGSAMLINDSAPQNRVLVLENWDEVLVKDGRWTLELLTSTPFGLERLRTPSGQPAVVTFDLDRTIEVNGTFTTIE